MTKQEAARWTPPHVERGVPIPPPYRKKLPTGRASSPPSPWIAWLLGLKPGDTFTTSYFDGNNVHHHLKRLGIGFERRSTHKPRCLGGNYWRFWITSGTTRDFVAEFINAGDGI